MENLFTPEKFRIIDWRERMLCMADAFGRATARPRGVVYEMVTITGHKLLNRPKGMQRSCGSITY